MKLSVHQSHSLFYLWAFSFCQVSRLQCRDGLSESHLYSSTRCPPLQACFDLTKLRVLPGLKHYDLRYVAKLQQQLTSACRTSVLYIPSCTSNQGLNFCSFFPSSWFSTLPRCIYTSTVGEARAYTRFIRKSLQEKCPGFLRSNWSIQTAACSK